MWFQSTRPRGARRLCSTVTPFRSRFQSTRPRGARRDGYRDRCAVILVSIHAPAWGATRRVHAHGGRRPVSIHAPAWGATSSLRLVPGISMFQSTRPRGARQVDTSRTHCSVVFQSTRPRGARLSPNWTNTNYSTKQSYIQAATKLTKITRPAVPQFCCQGTRANIVINQHHLPFARHRARRLAKPQGHKVSSHQNAPPFFANSSRGYIHAGYLLTHQ